MHLQPGILCSAGFMIALRPLRRALRLRPQSRGFASQKLAAFATIDPDTVSGSKPHQIYNFGERSTL
jgi:hypothetical protein